MKRAWISLSAALLLLPIVTGDDWPQYGGPRRDGTSRETGLRKSWPKDGPPLVWTFTEAGVGYAGPAVVGDRLYLSGGRGDAEYVFALDLTSNPPKEVWSVRLGPLFNWKGNSWNHGPNVSPTVSGDAVYALGGFGELVCVEAATGKERWRVNLPKELGGEVNPIGGGLEDPTPLGWGYSGAPLVEGDRVICVPGGKRGLFAALDRKTGQVVWRSKEVTEQTSYSSPVATEIGGVRQYVQVINSGIVGIAAEDGRVLWQYRRAQPYDDVVCAAPVVHDGYVFSSVGFGQGCDLIRVRAEGSTFKVEKILSDKSVQNRDGGMVMVGGHLYCHSEGRGWICREFPSMKEVWTERRKLDRGSITYADERLYCCSEEGVVAFVEASPRGWIERGRFTLPKESAKRRPSGKVWTHPVIAQGKLYLRDQEVLYCLDLRP